MLPELEQGLIGAAPGEKRNVTVNFPPDYRAHRACGQVGDFRHRDQDGRGAGAAGDR